MTPSPIRRYLRGKTILLTGGTGFLGKVIVERLLRAAPDIERIYLLIRTAADSPARTRFESEVLASPVFDAPADREGEVWRALLRGVVVPVAGDVSQPRLGLADDDYVSLAASVDIIINGAASVSFDAPVDEALLHNTRSVEHIAAFARGCRSAALVHVSTAYVSGQRTGRVAEEPLSPNVSACEIAAIDRLVAEVRDDAASARWSARATRGRLAEAGMTRARRLGWHDNYTYTKALGEMVLESQRGDVPTAIIRPAIIESSLRDPLPGWIQNLNVLDPMIIEYGRGRLPEFPLGRHTVLDVVPVDLVANALVAVLPLVPGMRQAIGYFTLGSGAINPLTGGLLYELGREYFLRQPLHDRAGQAIVPPPWTLPSPGRFREMFAGQAQNSTSMKRLMYLADLYEQYANIECIFDTTNSQRLLDGLDDADRALLDFDVRRIDWRAYIQDVHIPGLRRHVLRGGAGAPSEFVGGG